METNDDLTNDSDDSMPSVSGLLNNSSIKAKIVSGIYKINNKRGRSKVWDVFGLVKNENGDEIQNLVACKNCFSVYKFNTKSTSNLVKHKCYVFKNIKTDINIEKTEADAGEKKISALLVTKWTIENCRPFSIIRDCGFRNFVEFLISIGAKYGQNVDIDKLLPQPTTVARNIKNLHDKYFKVIKSEIMSIQNIGYGLTCDIWTDDYLRTAYLSLTIHYVKEGKLITRLLGLKSMKGESCTGQHICSKITTLLSEFECDLNDKAVMVTDRGSNMIAAFHSFNHIYCINHLLHNVIEKSIKEIPEITEICSSCAKLVKYLKKSRIDCSLQTSLKSYYCTRFNTTYYLLFAIEKSWVEITDILRARNELQQISNINLSYIGALIKILSSFEETTKMLEGEDYPTLHLTIVHIHRLKKICTVSCEDLEVIRNFKTKLSSLLDSIVLQNLTLNHKIGLFLFPPTNKLIQFNEAEKNAIKDECKNLMQSYANEMPEQEVHVLERLIKEEPEPDCLLTDVKDLFADFIQPVEIANSNNKINNELLAYENVNVVFHEDFNVLQWWHLHQNEFPLLFKVSCKILATPASSAASERVFSSARTLISEKRAIIGSDPVLVNQIMFLHSNVNQVEIRNNLEELL